MASDKYYCDYCHVSFADSAEARRKHRNGHQHGVQVRLHYASTTPRALMQRVEAIMRVPRMQTWRGRPVGRRQLKHARWPCSLGPVPLAQVSAFTATMPWRRRHRRRHRRRPLLLSRLLALCFRLRCDHRPGKTLPVVL